MIDIYEVLNKMESENLIRQNKKVGNYMQIYCPFHSEGNEKKPSCGVHLIEEYRSGVKYPVGFFHCFSCHAAYDLESALTEIFKIKHIANTGNKWLTDNITGYTSSEDLGVPLVPDDLIENILNKQATSCIDLLLHKKKQDYITEEELQRYRFTVPYMYERKLNDNVIAKYDIGFDPNWIPPGRKRPVPCITFPVRDRDGNTLFIARRSIQGKLFNLPEGIEKPVYGIYEIPKHCKTVVICESCFNALTSVVYGKPAVALFGTGTPYQIRQIKELGASEYIIALDPDAAGKRGTEKLMKELSKTAIVWTYEGIPEGKDINDLSRDEFNNLELV